jgi:hypothetical protein
LKRQALPTNTNLLGLSIITVVDSHFVATNMTEQPTRSSDHCAAPDSMLLAIETSDRKEDNSNPCAPLAQVRERSNLDLEPPYSTFNIREKRLIVTIIACTTLIQPLPATIYYPVITLLARELHVSVSDINLTITAYLVSPQCA